MNNKRTNDNRPIPSKCKTEADRKYYGDNKPKNNPTLVKLIEEVMDRHDEMFEELKRSEEE